MNSSPSLPPPSQTSVSNPPPPDAPAPEASLSVVDLTTMPLEELRKINADYLPDNRAKLESVILNPFYDPETRIIRLR